MYQDQVKEMFKEVLRKDPLNKNMKEDKLIESVDRLINMCGGEVMIENSINKGIDAGYSVEQQMSLLKASLEGFYK